MSAHRPMSVCHVSHAFGIRRHDPFDLPAAEITSQQQAAGIQQQCPAHQHTARRPDGLRLRCAPIISSRPCRLPPASLLFTVTAHRSVPPRAGPQLAWALAGTPFGGPGGPVASGV